ncbi:MAG: vWA domain-containing protein [Chloroflexota bacterium]
MNTRPQPILKPLIRTSLLLLLFILSIALSPYTAKAEMNAEPPFPNLELVILLDESDSMWNWTDPNDWRIEALEHLINTLGVELSLADFRVAIVLFGTEAKVVGDGFISLKNDGSREQLIRDLNQAHVNMGTTDVLKGLEEARRLLNDHRPGYKPVVLVVSDGRPEKPGAMKQDHPNAWEAYIRDLQTYAATAFDDVQYDGTKCGSGQIGTPIYPMAIRAADFVEQYNETEKQLWLDLASSTGGTYSEILPNSTAEFEQKLQSEFTNFLREWLCVQVEESNFELLPIERTFTVYNNYFEVIFNIAKTDPNTQVTIFDANGELVTESREKVQRTTTASGHGESWAILRPPDLSGWNGDWNVRLEGEGSVRFTPIYISDQYSLEFVSPSGGAWPLGMDIAIQAVVKDSAGATVENATINNPRITVLGPDNATLPSSEVTYHPSEGIVAFVEQPGVKGRYRIEISADVNEGGSAVPISQIKEIELDKLPWLQVTSPLIDANVLSSVPIEMDGTLMLESREASGDSLRSEVNALLYRLNGSSFEETGSRYSLVHSPPGPGRYWGQITDNLPTGVYKLRFQLDATSPSGQIFNAPPVNVRFQVDDITPTPTATATQAATETPIPPTMTPEPTATATVADTSTPTPIPPTATPTESPVPPPQLPPITLPAWLLPLAGGGLLTVLLLVGALSYFRSRPSLRGMAIMDRSGLNDMAFTGGPFGLASQNLDVYDQAGAPLAKLRFNPHDERTARVEILSIDEDLVDGVEASGRLLTPGDEFYTQHDSRIRIGNIQLFFETTWFEDEV